MRPVSMSRRWTISGYMNMVTGCGGPDCNPDRFPVDLEDGSQRTVCFACLPKHLTALATAMISGTVPPPEFDMPMKAVDKAISFLPNWQRDYILEQWCEQVRKDGMKS